MEPKKLLFLLFLTCFTSAGPLFAQDAASFLKKGQTSMKEGQYEEALVYFSVSIGLNDKLYLAWIGRAEARIALEEDEAAMEDFNKAIALNPEESSAWLGRSALKRKSGDLIGAARDFNEGVAAKARAWKKKWF